MSSFLQTPLFSLPNVDVENTPSGMAKKFNVPYLGKLPMDTNLMKSCDTGTSFLENYPNSPTAIAFQQVVDKIISSTQSG